MIRVIAMMKLRLKVPSSDPPKGKCPILGERSSEKQRHNINASTWLKHWKEKSGYHERSLTETGVYRFKQRTGNKLTSRTFNSQHTVIMIKVKMISTMNRLGMPEYRQK